MRFRLQFRQLTLDDAARFVERNARRTDPRTSSQAAQDAFKHAVRHREIALAAHYEHPDGLTDFELAELVGISQPSIGKRRLELERVGFIEFAGITRPAPSGSSARVYRITAQGKTAYREQTVLNTVFNTPKGA